MDKTVPPGAAILLDFIRETEVGRSDRASYDVIYANKQHKLKQPLTTMNYGDIVDAQKAWSKNHGSSACGAYQFMRATLIRLAKEIPSISGKDIFTPDLQDRLGYHLLKRRGYEDFVVGKITLADFARRLAMEWASLPVLADCKGSHRFIKRGQSFYAGDGLNHALVKPEKVEAVLAEVLAVARRPVDAPKPAPYEPVKINPPPVNRSGLAALIAAALVGLGAWLASWPCSIFGVLCQ
jgi:muramidase (phage lysozyme)